MTDDPEKGDDGTRDTIAMPDQRTTPFEGHSTGSDNLGQRVFADRYEIRGLLGKGGMGNVYRAFDRELGEVVALKTLHRELAESEAAIDRFRAEVRLARRVTHRNVARTYDIGMAEDVPFLTMEFIDGQSLDHLIRVRRRLEPAVAMDLAREIATGLGAAHEAGVVHQDLKPANILLEEGTDRVVLSDFGIARARDAADERGGFAGTPAYMAPEQVRGVGTLDGRADLYSLGVILFEMLTGQLPFHGPTPMATALARMMEDVPDVRAFNAELADDIADIVHRLLCVDRNDRYSDARAVRSAITAAGGRADTISPSGETRALRPGDGGSAKTVAVLPLRLRGTDTPDYLRDGLTEELIDELSMSTGLRVKPRGAVLKYRGDDVDPLHAGRQLGVQVVVEGSFRVSGDRLRVRLAAVSVDEGFQLWAHRFDGDPGDLFQVCGEAADAIADALTVERAERNQDVLTDPVTIDLYMRARKLMWTHWNGELESALDLWERVLERAPDDPRVLAGAATYFGRLSHTRRGDAESQPYANRAEAYAEHAIAVAPQWPEPHVALAVLHWNKGEFGGTMRHVDEALTLAPAYVDALTLGGKTLLEAGPIDRAIELLEQACEVDPNAFGARFELARARALLGDFAEADALLAIPVEEGDPRFFRAINRSRIDLWRSGEPQWVDDDVPDPPSSHAEMALFLHFARETTVSGRLPDTFEALAQVAQARLSRNSRMAFLTFQIGSEFACSVGEWELGLELAEKAVASGLLDVVWARHCPVLEGIRGRERFARLLEALEERRAEVMEEIEMPAETLILS